MIITKRLLAASLALALFSALPAVPVFAQTPTVVVNGQVVTFDQPAIERAGRVFVPLRGVFERLGATVVYYNGDINATGNGRNVHLHIGSTQALVNGQTAYMDQAPFLVGARTLIPLRFVAQALGASVNWNASNNTVYIQSGTGSSAVPTTPNPTTNVINRLNPAPGAHVGGSFTLRGHTRPGSTLTFSAVSTANVLGGVIGVPLSNYGASATADANGNFSVPITINVTSGGSLRITIRSVSPAGVTVTRVVGYST